MSREVAKIISDCNMCLRVKLRLKLKYSWLVSFIEYVEYINNGSLDNKKQENVFKSSFHHSYSVHKESRVIINWFHFKTIVLSLKYISL